MCGIAGNNLRDASGTLAEAGREKLEVGELVVDSLGELAAALVAQSECRPGWPAPCCAVHRGVGATSCGRHGASHGMSRTTRGLVLNGVAEAR
jgi:hypothetical protein